MTAYTYANAGYVALLSPGSDLNPAWVAVRAAILAAGGSLGANGNAAGNQLLNDLHGLYNPAYPTANVYPKLVALYGLLGGTAASHALNWKDPRPDDSAFCLSFYGSPLHDGNGVTWNGTTQYADTKFVPSLHSPGATSGLGYYSRNDVVGGERADMGSVSSGAGLNLVTKTDQVPGGVGAYGATYTGGLGPTNNRGDGFITLEQPTASERTLYRNGALLQASNSTGTPALPTRSVFIGALNVGFAYAYSAKTCALACISTGLTTAESLAFHAAVIAYQTALGRNV